MNIMDVRPVLILGVVLAVILTGCERGKHPENVKPGDVDYPVENPHPVSELHFEAIMPAITTNPLPTPPFPIVL
jgi:hypothetical protein